MALMKEQGPARDGDPTARAIRFDLIIALSALLISSLATGASWWQARVLVAQTQVLQDQLGAQVWPYISVSMDTDGSSTVKINIANDGLGPAVLRSAVVTVDGVPRANFIDVMHAILGPNLVARAHGDRIGLSLSAGAPGSVLRPGESVQALGLKSKRYAVPLLRAYKRMNFRTCYCAIIPGKCWQTDSASLRDPQPVQACPVIASDLLHAPIADELLNTNY
jgi:hypothetical protein